MASEVHRAVLGGRTVTVYASGCEDSPAVYVSMYKEEGEGILERCASMGCPAFDLVSVSDLDWNADLSPWPHGPVVPKGGDFAGGADGYASFIVDSVVPHAEGILGPPSGRIIAGYSMGGLFALYAPHVTDMFRSCVSASGSVWYPGFVDFVGRTPFRRVPDSVYLSVGDRESRTRNRFLSEVEACDSRLLETYLSRGIDAVFETNPGNHFRDADIRLAKGITWALTRRRDIINVHADADS